MSSEHGHRGASNSESLHAYDETYFSQELFPRGGFHAVSVSAPDESQSSTGPKTSKGGSKLKEDITSSTKAVYLSAHPATAGPSKGVGPG